MARPGTGDELQVPIETLLSEAGEGLAPVRVLGRSREGRPISGHRFGSGPLRVSLIAGCHADEPVGPHTLRRLAALLAGLPGGHPLLTGASWWIVPRVNPDGDAKNQEWAGRQLPAVDHLGLPDRAFDLAAYLEGVCRDLPGDDLEFGFPRDERDLEARPEALAVARFLRAALPLDLHASLHGMAFAPGPWFLLEPAWRDRTAELRRRVADRVHAMGYSLFDVDRKGEKGFERIAPGFSTRPDSAAMAAYFMERGDERSASSFRPTSMEWVRRGGGDPLTLVSEVPLFLLEPAPEVARPANVGTEARLRFHRWLEEVLGGLGGAAAARRAAACGIRGMPTRDQMRLQLELVNAGLAAVAAAGDGRRAGRPTASEGAGRQPAGRQV